MLFWFSCNLFILTHSNMLLGQTVYKAEVISDSAVLDNCLFITHPTVITHTLLAKNILNVFFFFFSLCAEYAAI